MLKFQIVQYIKDRDKNGKLLPTRRIEWNEDMILFYMKKHMPIHTHPAMEKAWKKTLSQFKLRTIHIKKRLEIDVE